MGLGEWTGEWAGEWVSEWASESASEWASEWAGEWAGFADKIRQAGGTTGTGGRGAGSTLVMVSIIKHY